MSASLSCMLCLAQVMAGVVIGGSQLSSRRARRPAAASVLPCTAFVPVPTRFSLTPGGPEPQLRGQLLRQSTKHGTRLLKPRTRAESGDITLAYMYGPRQGCRRGQTGGAWACPSVCQTGTAGQRPTYPAAAHTSPAGNLTLISIARIRLQRHTAGLHTVSLCTTPRPPDSAPRRCSAGNFIRCVSTH
jgi:hypothetical protein